MKQIKLNGMIDHIFGLYAIVILGSSVSEQNSSNNNQNENQNQVSKDSSEDEDLEVESEVVYVLVADFSTMDKASIEEWSATNKITIEFDNDYSGTIEVANFIEQSNVGDLEIVEGSKIIITYSIGKEPSLFQQ